MITKSTEQMEDAAIQDAITTAVSLHLRNHKREMLNYLRSVMGPEIDMARLNGREIDVNKFMQRALALANNWVNNDKC